MKRGIIAAVYLRSPQKNEKGAITMAKNDNAVTVSPAAAQSCTRSIQLLKPYADEPRVAAGPEAQSDRQPNNQLR